MAEFNAMDTAAFKGVWVFCEQREGQIQTISYQLLSEGRKLANDLGAIINLDDIIISFFLFFQKCQCFVRRIENRSDTD